MTQEKSPMQKATSNTSANWGLHNLPERGVKGTEKTVVMNGSTVRMTLTESGWINRIVK